MFENKKLIVAILAVSLAINFIFIGAAGSAAWRWNKIKGDSAWLEKRIERSEQRILRRLDGADRDLAQGVFRERRPMLLAAVNELRAARTDFRTALRAETPDPVALSAALDRSQAAAQQINETFHAAIRDMAQGLSPEARREISSRMRRHHDDD